MNLQTITKEWVEGVKKYYESYNYRDGVHFRGHFAGMSGHEILNLVNHLYDNAERYPIVEETNETPRA